MYRRPQQGFVIQSMLPLAEFFAKKKGIRVIQKGNKFIAFGNDVILIPTVPPGLEKKFENALLGGTMHEAKHLDITDFAVMIKSKENPKHGLTNFLEDLRIDNINVEEYPGGRSILGRFQDYIKDNYRLVIERQKQYKDNGMEIPKSLKIDSWKKLNTAAYDIFFGYKPDFEAVDERFYQILEKCSDLFDKIKTFHKDKQGTQQCLELSEEIYKRIIEILPKAESDDEEENQFNVPEQDAKGKGTKPQKDKTSGSEKKVNDKDKDTDKEEQSDGPDKKESEKTQAFNKDKKLEEQKEKEDSLNDENLYEDFGEEIEEEEAIPDDDSDEMPTDSSGTSTGSDEGDEGNFDVPANDDDDEITSSPHTNNEPNRQDKRPYGGSLGTEEDKEMWDQLSKELQQSTIEDRMDMINEIFGDQIAELGAGGKHMPHPEILEKDVLIQDTSCPNINFQQPYSDTILAVAPQISILRGRLLPTLMSIIRKKWRINKEEGEEVNEADLAFVKHGKKNVMKIKAPKIAVNTAIIWLGDVSGSMIGEKIAQLRRAFIACAETVEPLHIPYEILTFTTTGYPDYKLVDRSIKDGTYGIYNRYEPIKHIVIKSFGERLNDSRWRLMAMSSGSHNCDPEALWWAASRIAQRREKRKIIFMMHDGYPNLQCTAPDCHHKLDKELINSILQLDNLGIEVFGVGILTPVPEKYYPRGRFHAIMNDKGIATAIYSLLEDKLKEIYHASLSF